MNPITLKNLEDSFKNKFSTVISHPVIQPSLKESDILDLSSKKSSPKSGQSDKIPRKKVVNVFTTPDEDDKAIVQDIASQLIPKTSPIYIEIENVSLAVKLETVFECVLFSVSPEYRILTQKDEKKRDLMFQTALEHFNDNEKIRDIEYLSESFNIQIYILNKEGDKFRVINKTGKGNNNNKLYIVDKQQTYEVLGYNENGYDVFIY